MDRLAKTYIVFGVSLMLAEVVAQDRTYIATFSMAGASGNVTFAQGPGANTTIYLAMSLPAGTYNWAVHERPNLYDQRPPCNEMFTGGVLASGGNLTAAHGQLSGGTNVMAEFGNDQLRLMGTNSLSGRSLVLEDTSSGAVICANILDFDTDVVTAVAKFMSPFAGTVTFRQRQDDPSALTSILVDLYDVLGPLEAVSYRWGIHSVEEYNKNMDLEQRCSNTMPAIFNPTGADASSCQSDEHSTCPIGGLSGKFGDVTVNPVSSSRTRYYIDTNLSLGQDGNSVLGKNLVFADSSGTFIACSPIQVLPSKTVSAEISVSGVNGSLEFRQRSPYDATHISVNLANLQGLAGGYHVHEQPVKGRINKDDLPASNDNVGGHYNPFGVDAGGSPSPGTGTHDQYEVGDISGKFGRLTSMDAFSDQFVDWNMQLFGKYSVIGRSIVIHKEEANARWVYGNIGYPTEVTTVKGDFSSVVAGEIVFRQDAADPFSDTTIFVEVTHADGSDTTSNHNFHVHDKPIENDYVSATDRCASAAAHFNPFVDVDNGYDQCNFTNPYRCEVGDLSQKLATIDIPSVSSSSNKYFFTDPLLPLTGYYSISGKSVVIHTSERGAPRYACANLYCLPTVSVQTREWVGGPVISGSVALSQASRFDQAKISIELSGLDQRAGGWHIHVLPIDPNNPDGPCSAASVQAHFNPFGVVGSPATGTHDMYEVGDLSGKFNSLAGVGSISDVYMDTNLDLTGPRSAADRSIVIHRDDSEGSRMVCSNVYHSLTNEDFHLVAHATFQGGVVTLKQIQFACGYQGDTSLEVDLTAVEENVEHRLEIPQRVCADDGIYNPYEISVAVDQCSISRMRLCAVGDLASKHGTVNGTQRTVFTDINLPLFGLHSVIGRLLKITAAGGDGFCSMITPDASSGKKVTHVFPSTTTFNVYDFRVTVALAIAEGRQWQVVTSEEPVQSTEFPSCTSLSFWVIGPNADDLVTAFSKAIKEGSLGSYNPTDLCSAGSGGSGHAAPSGLMVLLSTILGILVTALPQREV